MLQSGRWSSSRNSLTRYCTNCTGYTGSNHCFALQVKEFIRRAKAWRNDVWEKVKDGKPKSYLMSVLVLRAYEIAYRKLQGDTSTSRIATQ